MQEYTLVVIVTDEVEDTRSGKLGESQLSQPSFTFSSLSDLSNSVHTNTFVCPPPGLGKLDRVRRVHMSNSW